MQEQAILVLNITAIGLNPLIRVLYGHIPVQRSNRKFPYKKILFVADRT